MKNFLKVAAEFAALAAASPALASTNPGGHWEWSARQAPGPSKSSPPGPVRVWVNDGASAMLGCACPMMEAGTTDCRMDMPGKHILRSNG